LANFRQEPEAKTGLQMNERKAVTRETVKDYQKAGKKKRLAP
jgi:hypothetical protein